MLSLGSDINGNEFRYYIEIRIWHLHSCISKFRLNLPPTYYWQQLAKGVYCIQCNLIRAQIEHTLAAKSGIRSFKEVKTTFQIIQIME